MSAGSEGDGATAVRPPPFGTAQRIRTRAIWAVSLFTAAIPPAVVGFGISTATDDQVNVAMPLAFLFWVVGFLFALWAAVPTLHHWDGLPAQTRWLGALPLLSVSLFLSLALLLPLLS